MPFFPFSKLNSKTPPKSESPKFQTTTFEHLPSHMVQNVCQLLIRSGNFKNVLSLRSANWNLYTLINDLPLLLSLSYTLNDYTELMEMVDYVDYVTINTHWKVEYLKIKVFYHLQEHQKHSPEEFLQFLVTNSNFYLQKLRHICFETSSSGRNVNHCDEIASVLCNNETTIDFESIYSFVSLQNFTQLHRVRSFRMYIDREMTANCGLWKLVNLENLTIVCFDDHVDKERPLKLDNLRELRIDTIKTLFHLAPLPTSDTPPWFPNVKYFRFRDFKRTNQRFPQYLLIHFPNLEHFDAESENQFVEKYLTHETIFPEGGRDNVMHLCSETCVTLKLSSLIFCNIAIPENLQELFVAVDLNQNTLSVVLDHIVSVLSSNSMHLRIVNLYLHRGDYLYDIHPVALKAVISFVSNLINAIGSLEVVCVSSAIELKKRELKNWSKRRADEFNQHPCLKAVIIDDEPLFLSGTITAALMLRLDKLTHYYQWTIRKNRKTGEVIEFEKCI